MKDEIFENFLKRHGDKDQPRTVPRDLFQVAVFFFRPVVEELNFEKEEEAKKILKKSFFLNKGKTKFALQNITEFSSKLLENQKFVFPFYSEDVFMSPKEAENYIPRFIKKLIGEQKLPVEVILNNSINYDIVQTGIVPLSLVTLEKVNEFKDIKLEV
jgi:hypothetical protein